MASAGGGSLLCFPVLDGNLGRRWWGLLPSGSQLSSFRSRCRSNWAEWDTVPGNDPGERPAQLGFGLVGICNRKQKAFQWAKIAVIFVLEKRSLIWLAQVDCTCPFSPPHSDVKARHIILITVTLKIVFEHCVTQYINIITKIYNLVLFGQTFFNVFNGETRSFGWFGEHLSQK